jgi:hypothetical protein
VVSPIYMVIDAPQPRYTREFLFISSSRNSILGDPFGDSRTSACLYSTANYSSLKVHPPQIGWSLDGYDIFGRHLDLNAEGWAGNALDQCGGHSHGSYGYHYHAQVTQAYTQDAAVKTVAKGTAYASFTPGVFKVNILRVDKVTFT